MPKLMRFVAAPAVLAAFSLTITPAFAAEMTLPVAAPAYADAVPVLDVEQAQTAQHHRSYRHRYYHRRGPGLGDVLAGVLVVGAIAHVASKASRQDDRRYRERDYRRDVRYDDSRGIDRAVDMCIDAVERERRVETVDRVDRTADGWRVDGTITRGDSYTCRIDEDGRGVSVDFGPSGARFQDDDRDEDDDRYEGAVYNRDSDADDDQWDDDRYASEWSRVDREGSENQSAYPGGPVDNSEEVDGDLEIGTGYQGTRN